VQLDLSTGQQKRVLSKLDLMAKPIAWRLGEQVYQIELGAKVDKKALYGFAKRVVERDGHWLKRGFLCPDGTLIRNDAVSLVKLDPQGSPVEEVVTEVAGKVPDILPSSFDQENKLEPVPLTTLIGFNVRDSYPLSASTLPGGLYATTFSYRKSHHHQDALLFVKENEAWLLVGTFKLTTFVGQTVVYDFFDAEADETGGDSEDLDFAMV
jgi:hypothetical protein